MGEPEQSVLYAAELCRCASLCEVGADRVMTLFSGALQGAGATVVGTLAHEFEGGGLTCVLILAESHAVLHTWPESGTVNIDIFSCSTRLKSLDAIAALGRSLAADTVQIQEIPRVDGRAPSPEQRN